jgi:hypothetical protein
LLKVGRLGSNYGIHRPGEKKNNRFAEFLFDPNPDIEKIDIGSHMDLEKFFLN